VAQKGRHCQESPLNINH